MSALEQVAAWWAALVTALHTWWFVPAAVVIGLAMLVVDPFEIESRPALRHGRGSTPGECGRCSPRHIPAFRVENGHAK